MQIIGLTYDNYLKGADNYTAPEIKENMKEKEIEMTISITLSKNVKVKVSDYTIIETEDENGNLYEDIDYSDCDLKKAVKDQLYLPQDAGEILQNSDVSALESIADNFLDWNVDDFEVIIE